MRHVTTRVTVLFFLGLSMAGLMAPRLAEAAGSSAKWSYVKGSPVAPDNWPGACGSGKIQSPINIQRSGNPSTREAAFLFENYDSTPERSSIANTGYTAKLDCTPARGDAYPQVSGGGLPSKFTFAQLHFHWGVSDSSGGSEHTISKVSYPMELHLVHFNSKYGEDIGEAIAEGQGAQDTLAVLGIMFQLHSKPNPKLDPIIKALEEIQRSGSKMFTTKFPLQDLLPSDTDRFYRYNGSLTTPGCNEIVVWTVFKEPLDISSRQMSRFRDLTSGNPELKNNFRPTQPLNGRVVYEVDTSKDNGAGGPVATAVSVVLAAVLATVFGKQQ